MVQALQARGVPAASFALAANTLQWDIAATQPIRIAVRRRDVASAREILKQIRSDSVDIDPDELERAAIEGHPDAPSAKAIKPPKGETRLSRLGPPIVIAIVLFAIAFEATLQGSYFSAAFVGGLLALLTLMFLSISRR